MTEAGWLNGPDAPAMIEWAIEAAARDGRPPRLNDRTLRLFVCACYRANMGTHRSRDSTSRLMLQMLAGAEGAADGRRSMRWELGDKKPLPLQTDLRRAALLIAAGEHALTYTSLLRDVVGNPFRPAALSGSTPTAVSLAQAAYDEPHVLSGEMDPARLAVLSDALEEAGCADEDVLDHLRSAGPHVRGCWVIDLILGKS